MAYAVTPEDVAARWRPLDAAESAVAVVLLADATAILDAKRPQLAAQVAAGTVPARLVTIVLAEAVQRVLRNPDVQASINLGSDGSVGQSFPTAGVNAARPRLEISDFDLSVLTPAAYAVGTSNAIYSVPYGPL